jgi:hypothetical protein
MTPGDPPPGGYGPDEPAGGPHAGNPNAGGPSTGGPSFGRPGPVSGPPGSSVPPNSSHPSPAPDDLVGHPDLNTLADLDAGLLDPADAARAGRHASSCAQCRRTLAAFVAVRRDLRRLAPPELPAAVAARLDATVAQLRASNHPVVAAPQAAPPGPAPPQVPVSTVLPPRPPVPPPVDLAAVRESREQRRLRGSRLIGRVAASVIVAAALVGVGTAIIQHTDDNGTVATSAALPGEQQTTGGQGGRGGPGNSKDQAGGASEPSTGPQDIPEPVPSYNDEGSLLAAIPEIAAKSAVEIITRAGLNGPAGAMANITRRSKCASGITGTFGSPVAVQQIRFESQTAYVFVYANPVTGGHSVVVVSSDCGDVPVPQVLYRH